MNEILNFLRALSNNNNREWFNNHKDEYLYVKSIVDNIALALIREITTFEPEAASLRVSDTTYRIYRDVRFSSDKRPYKTHIGIFVNPPYGKKSNRMGYYLHIEPDNCFLAVGTIGLSSRLITALRHSIYDNIEEYLEIIENPVFKQYFKEIGEDYVKTAPKGFSKNWKYIDLVRPRNFVASYPLSPKELESVDFIEKIGGIFETAKPFNHFFNYTIDEFQE